MKLALITIGQTPRTDILKDITDLLKNIDYTEYGALDGLTRKQIEQQYFPRGNEEFYVTRLADGTQIKVSKQYITEKLKKLVREVENKVDIIVIMCTGDFEIKSKKIIIIPSKIMTKITEALSPKRIAVFIPDRNQTKMTLNKWSKITENVDIYSWSPYTDPAETLREYAENISEADFIVMDCIGYTKEHGKTVSRYSNKPVLLPRILAVATALSFITKENSS